MILRNHNYPIYKMCLASENFAFSKLSFRSHRSHRQALEKRLPNRLSQDRLSFGKKFKLSNLINPFRCFPFTTCGKLILKFNMPINVEISLGVFVCKKHFYFQLRSRRPNSASILPEDARTFVVHCPGSWPMLWFLAKTFKPKPCSSRDLSQVWVHGQHVSWRVVCVKAPKMHHFTHRIIPAGSSSYP